MTIKILLASDGSENALEAARIVASIAKELPIEVTIMSVIQLPEVGGMVSVESWLPELLQHEQDHAKQVYIQTNALFANTQATVRSEIREGLVGYEIVQYASDNHCDLVVIGAKGHSAVDRILLGSVSDYVATHAKCSALVVRPTGLHEEAQRHLRVAIGFDNSHSSTMALQQFRQFRMGREIDLDLIAVCQVLRSFRQDLLPKMVEQRASIREAAAKAAAEAAQSLQQLTPHVRSHVVEAEHIGEAIVNFTEQQRSDILVVGDTERGVLGRLLLGSVSRYVLRHTACSVWITRNPE